MFTTLHRLRPFSLLPTIVWLFIQFTMVSTGAHSQGHDRKNHHSPTKTYLIKAEICKPSNHKMDQMKLACDIDEEFEVHNGCEWCRSFPVVFDSFNPDRFITQVSFFSVHIKWVYENNNTVAFTRVSSFNSRAPPYSVL